MDMRLRFFFITLSTLNIPIDTFDAKKIVILHNNLKPTGTNVTVRMIKRNI